MTVNEGIVDRIARLVIAAAAVLVSWWAGFGSVGGILLLVFGGWMVVTAAVGYCPAYQLLKISTRPSPHRISTPGLRAVTHH
jgi:Inner membrane protein YgaP-like, transmembrane domain